MEIRRRNWGQSDFIDVNYVEWLTMKNENRGLAILLPQKFINHIPKDLYGQDGSVL